MTSRHCHIYVFHPDLEVDAYNFFDIGKSKPYFKPSSTTRFSVHPIAKALSENPRLQVSCYLSGTFLEGIAENPEEIEAIKGFVDKGQLELLLGTYHQSFSCLYSAALFRKDITAHKQILQSLFNVTPSGFLNTMAIFSNDLVKQLKKEQVDYALVPRVEWFQGKNIHSRVFKSKGGLDLLLIGESRHDSELYVSYLDSGTSRHWEVDTIQTQATIQAFEPSEVYNLPNPVGLDPFGRDLTYYLGNSLQKQIFKSVAQLSDQVIRQKNESLTQNLLKLSSAAVFSQISNLAQKRHEAYKWLMNCLTDMELQLK